MPHSMPKRCQMCSAVSCCVTCQPPLPVEEHISELVSRPLVPYRHTLQYWIDLSILAGSRARARLREA